MRFLGMTSVAELRKHGPDLLTRDHGTAFARLCPDHDCDV
jgi:hypothetical protein